MLDTSYMYILGLFNSFTLKHAYHYPLRAVSHAPTSYVRFILFIAIFSTSNLFVFTGRISVRLLLEVWKSRKRTPSSLSAISTCSHQSFDFKSRFVCKSRIGTSRNTNFQ